jgi:CheY-like chemotaxis protein
MGVGVDPTLDSAVRGIEILVVEDDPDTQESLCDLLELYGARVTCASSAAEALRLAGAGIHYDVVVTDLELPGRDGLWLVSELRRMAGPDAPPSAILLTGSARPGIERIAIEAGFDVFLRKPVEANSLLRAIAQQRGSDLA